MEAGERYLSNNFGWCVVVEYRGKKDVSIVFEDCGRTATVQADSLRRGLVTPSNVWRTNTQEVWLEKALAIHQDTYDYTNTIFTRYDEKVEILCKKCNNTFSVLATDHINRKVCGCPTCARLEAQEKMLYPFDKFVSESGDIHNNKYTYDRASYKGMKHPVTVVCNIHGEFSVNAARHRKGGGKCPRCAEGDRIKASYETLPTRENYQYLFPTENGYVWIAHEECGNTFKETLQRARSSSRYLCTNCVPVKEQKATFENFITKATALHGDTYEYSNWISSANNLTFLHKACGNTYEAHAGSHITANYGKGVGCPYCATYGFSPARPACLYIISAPQGYVKVGITHQEVIARIRQISKSTRKLGWVFEAKYQWELSGLAAAQVEKEVHKYLDKNYFKPPEKFDGSGETYIGISVEEAYEVVSRHLLEAV